MILEDQLLAEVVKAERPDLEELKVIFTEFVFWFDKSDKHVTTIKSRSRPWSRL